MNTILKYLFFCHRIPERSFFYKGKQFPICARCTGILVGYFLAIALIIIHTEINFLWSVIFLIPLVIDGFGQLYNKWVSNNPRRFVTGILAGISTIMIIKNLAQLGFVHGEYIGRYLLK